MAIQTASALILQRWDYRETSIVLSMFTEQWGRFHGLIKGFRAQPPRYRTPAMPGSVNTIVFYEKPGASLLLIAQCDLADVVASGATTRACLTAQARILELLARGTPMRDAQPVIFRLAMRALRAIPGHREPSSIARLFELKFLQAAGISPAVHECAHCARSVRGTARLSLRLGGLLCQRCLPYDPEAQPLLPGTLASMQHTLQTPWELAARLQWNPAVRRQLEQLLDRFVAYHLDTRMKSREPYEAPVYAHA